MVNSVLSAPLLAGRTLRPLPVSSALLGYLTVGALALAVVALLTVVVLAVRGRKLRGKLTLLQQGADGMDLLAVLHRQQEQIAELTAAVTGAQRSVVELREGIADAIRHVAVVRYDAFGDMGGRVSFSAALLDDVGDGLVVSTINGRSDSRTYAKGVKGGDGDGLSPEERQAIGYALGRAQRSLVLEAQQSERTQGAAAGRHG